MNKNLWLFDYQQGEEYERFSKCEDSQKRITEFLKTNYNFSNKTILEIGAGSGKFTSFLSEYCSKLFVVEKSKNLMEINQRKNKNLKNIQYFLANAKDIDFPKSSVDIIFAGWSLTSMRDLFDELFPIFKKILKKDGILIIVENAGNDDFCKLIKIENFTAEMWKEYLRIGFKKRAILDTIIKLPNKNVFYGAFPKFNNINLKSLSINHKVLIMDINFNNEVEKEKNENSRV